MAVTLVSVGQRGRLYSSIYVDFKFYIRPTGRDGLTVCRGQMSTLLKSLDIVRDAVLALLLHPHHIGRLSYRLSWLLMVILIAVRICFYRLLVYSCRLF